MASARTPPADSLQAFGRWLKQERELRDLEREDLAAATRLGLGVIEALESGDDTRMPPRAYLVGYLRSYATAAGLDPDELVLRWQEAAGPEPEADRRPRARRWLPLVVAALVLGVVGALLASALWGKAGG
jgi:cytoskeletal protein RodZ